MTEHLGELHISSEVKEGTRVEILLPKKMRAQCDTRLRGVVKGVIIWKKAIYLKKKR